MTNDSHSPESGRRQAPRWIYGVLLASLMINMLFVGLAAGRMWAHGGWYGGHGHHRGGDGVTGFLHRLPEGRRQVLRVSLEATRTEVRAMREEVRQLRQQARSVLSRDPFDAAAFAAAMAQVNAARTKIGERIAKGMSDLAGQMTVDERKAFAAHEERRGRHGKREDH